MRKITLLVADDEDVFRKGIVRYIQLHSDRFDPVLSAVNGEEAVDLIFQRKPELMLLDIQMPKKDGIEVMRETYDAGIFPITVIVSGYDEFQYAQQALRYGAKDYILKPMLSSGILKKLNEIADKYIGKEEEEKTEKENSNTNNVILMAKQYMEEHYYEDLTLESVAEKAGISAGYLSTLFVQTFGYGFVECLNKMRVEHACPYLLHSKLKTYEIAYKVGFHDEKYFSKVFRKITGTTPSAYRKYGEEK